MAEVPPSQRPCGGVDCGQMAGTLQCPKCLEEGRLEGSFFCSQECFKRNWVSHKEVHKKKEKKTVGVYNPFPNYNFTGPLRPVYPLSPKRAIPPSIKCPDYAKSGIPSTSRSLVRPNKVELLDAAAQEAMRKVCRLAREVLDIAAAALRPGITTDAIDGIVHKACLERDSYPSTLNYHHYPKSLCTSINEVICHGIPDQRVLLDGDIINLDVTLYHGGCHGDLNETYYVGDRALADPESVRVVETARECLDLAIAQVKPGTLFREFGNVIEKHAKERNCSVIRTYVGHGVNSVFHAPPNIPHYAKNKAVGECKPGMTFTIEPMVALGKYRDVTWPDNWTSTTIDGRRTAQFVTETGVEVLTARLPTSPGGPVPMPT